MREDNSLFGNPSFSLEDLERKAKLFERLLAKHGFAGIRIDNTNMIGEIQYSGPGIWIVDKKRCKGNDGKWQRRWRIVFHLDEIPPDISSIDIMTNKIATGSFNGFYKRLVDHGVLERCYGIIDTTSDYHTGKDDRILVHVLTLEWLLGMTKQGYGIDLLDDVDSILGFDPEYECLLRPWIVEEELQIQLDLDNWKEES